TDTSQTFDVTGGAATQLAWTVQPTNTVFDEIIRGPGGVTVQVQDAAGNPALEPSESLTETITVTLLRQNGAQTGASVASNVVTLANHNLVTGMPIEITDNGGTNLVEGTTYYVVNVSGNDFQLEASPGGGVITTFTDGSGIDFRLDGLDIGGGDDLATTVTADVDWDTSSVTFDDLSITEIANAYIFNATLDTDDIDPDADGGIPDELSNPFNIVGGTFVMDWHVPPTNTIAGVEIDDAADDVGPIVTPNGSGNIVVRIEDGSDNPITTDPSGLDDIDEAVTIVLHRLGGNETGATADEDDNTLTLTGHELVDGMPIEIAENGDSGLTEGTTYFVLNVDGDSFQLSATKGGSAVALTDSTTNVDFQLDGLDQLPDGDVLGDNVTSWTENIEWVDGTVTFENLNIDERAEDYYFTAHYDDDVDVPDLQNVEGVLDVDSNEFDILGASPASIVWREQPTNTIAGREINNAADSVGPILSPAGTSDPVVAVLDEFGNDAGDPGGAETITVVPHRLNGVESDATATDVGDFFTLEDHNLVDGMPIQLSDAGGTGLATDTTYFVVGVTGDNFQLATARGGAVEAITSGTGIDFRLHGLDTTPHPGNENANSITIPVTWGATSTSTYNDLNIDERAVDYVFTATYDPLTLADDDVDSTEFDILGDAPASIVWRVDPTNTIAGQEINNGVDTVGPISVVAGTSDPVVAVLDQFGNDAGDPTGDDSQTIRATLRRSGGVETGASATNTGDVLTLTNHELTNGVRIEITDAGASGIPTGAYYVINATATTFQVATTRTGTAVPVTADSTTDITFQLDGLDTSLPAGDQNVLSSTVPVDWDTSTTTYTDLNVDERAEDYQLYALYVPGGLTDNDDASDDFDILGAAPEEIVWRVHPTDTIAGREIDNGADTVGPITEVQGTVDSDPVVAVLDAYGNDAGDPSSGDGDEQISVTLLRPLGDQTGASADGDTDELNLPGNDLYAGMPIEITAAGGSGLTTGTTYFVLMRELQSDDFQLATTRGGAAIDIPSDSTGPIDFRLDGLDTTVTAAPALGQNVTSVNVDVDWGAATSTSTYDLLNIDERSPDYRLDAEYLADDLDVVESDNFRILGEAAASIAWRVHPTDTIAGVRINNGADTVGPITEVDADFDSDPVVAVLDAFGNDAGNPGGGGQTISATLRRSGGVETGASATNTGDVLTLTNHELTNGVRIEITDAGASGIPTGAYYVINATATTFQVATTRTGTAVPVTADSTNDITFQLDGLDTTVTAGPDQGENVLSSTVTVDWGTSTSTTTYADLNVDERAEDYLLYALYVPGGLTDNDDDSDDFDILGAAPSAMVWTDNPETTSKGSELGGDDGITVQVQDVFGNPAGNPGGGPYSITITLDVNDVLDGGTDGPDGEVDTGTISWTDSTVTYTGLDIDEVATGYQFDADTDVPGVPDDVLSLEFDIVAGEPDRIRFVFDPSDAVAGTKVTRTAMTPAGLPVVVEVQDNTGIAITTDPTGGPEYIRLTITTQPVGVSGELDAGAPDVAQVSTTVIEALVDWSTGRATFDSFDIDEAGDGYVLRASYIGDDDLGTDDSLDFDIVAGPPDRLIWCTQWVDGQDFDPGELMDPLSVCLVDEHGNVVDWDGPITITINTNPGGAPAFPGPYTMTDGVADLDDLLDVDEVANGYDLIASIDDGGTPYSTAPGASFDIVRPPSGGGGGGRRPTTTTTLVPTRDP
ncbi:MAG TPA: hypothetical protein VEA78_04260, partial [Acidimicrobiales bacterium]|nr:hypothetical protein [Acidimicrobiales bacterium]